jgi:tRNA(adenine34) deaminase
MKKSLKTNPDLKFMAEALKEAQKAFKKKEVPIGAVAVKDGKIIARAHNLRESQSDPTAHAEIICMQKAAKKLGEWRLLEVTIYSTLEPCTMCTGAMIHARVKDLVFGAHDLKAGACGSVINLTKGKILNHHIKVFSGIMADECKKILGSFFRSLRKKRKKMQSRQSRKRAARF